MALSVKHFFVSPKSDGPDPTLVQPSAWNHEHVLNSDTNVLLGRATAGVGAVEEIGLGSNFVFVGGNLTLVGNPKLIGNAGFGLPAGTTAQRDPAPVAGEIRFNSDSGLVEFWTGTAWANGPNFTQQPQTSVAIVASLNLDAVTSEFALATGTATVTAIQLANGQKRVLYVQDGFVIQYNSANIMPGQVDLTCRPNDCITLRGYPGNRVILEDMTRYDGQAIREFATLEITLDGGGAALVNGAAIDFLVPYNFTCIGWTVLADRSSTIYLDVQYCTYAQFDGGTSHPAGGDSIVGGYYPNTSSAAKGQGGMTGWTRTYFGGGDVIRAAVSSGSGVTQRVTLALTGWHV